MHICYKRKKPKKAHSAVGGALLQWIVPVPPPIAAPTSSASRSHRSILHFAYCFRGCRH
jgi:hypothetical protein